MAEGFTMIGIKPDTKKRFIVARNIYQGQFPHENVTSETFLIFLLNKFEEWEKTNANNINKSHY